MSRIIIFTQNHWEKHPESYPMIGRFMGPLSKLTIRFTDSYVDDGDVLIERHGGKWFVVPKDVFSTLVRANKLMDIERPWLNADAN